MRTRSWSRAVTWRANEPPICSPHPPTGGHGSILADGGSEEWIEAERIDTPHTHGTGCTLSSAITAHLALGATLPEAVRAGKAFVTEAIRHALALGGGIGPVDALWSTPPGGQAVR